MVIGRGKKLTAYKYPLTFPKWWPSLALMSHSSHFPILIACSILCLVLPHHCPTCTTIHRFLISPSVPTSPGTCFSLSFSIQSPTIWHHSLCMRNYPLTTPSFPLYPNSIPTYPILYTFLWKPTNQLSEGVVDDMAIHSPYNSPLYWS